MSLSKIYFTSHFLNFDKLISEQNVGTMSCLFLIIFGIKSYNINKNDQKRQKPFLFSRFLTMTVNSLDFHNGSIQQYIECHNVIILFIINSYSILINICYLCGLNISRQIAGIKLYANELGLNLFS